MAVSVSTVPFVLGLLMSWGGIMLGDVFYTENKVDPLEPELHPIHKEIGHGQGGYNFLPDDFVPLTFNESEKEVRVLEGKNLQDIDELNTNSSVDIGLDPETVAGDYNGGGSSKTEIKQDEDSEKMIYLGEKKVNKPLTIGTIAGICIFVAAIGSLASIIVAIAKKAKSHKKALA